MERNLPAELLLNIFKRLPEEQLRETILFVCKHWHRVLRSSPLIRINVQLRVPYKDSFENLLIDFERSLDFASSVNTIIIGDRADFFSNIRTHLQSDVDKLGMIIKLCRNLEQLKLWIRSSELYENITSEIFAAKNEFHSRFKLLELNLHPGPKPIMVDLTKLVNQAPFTLQKLIFHATAGRDIFFDSGDLLHNNASNLRTIQIKCPNSVMSKDCLEYLISGQLTHLEELNLFLSLVRSIKNPVPYMTSVHESDQVFNTLTNFCRTSLKSYNIAFTYYLGHYYLFSIDNCEIGVQKYSEINIPLHTIYIPPPGYNDEEDSDIEESEEDD